MSESIVCADPNNCDREHVGGMGGTPVHLPPDGVIVPGHFDHGVPSDATEQQPETALTLFHWSPASNRRSIDAYGLRPGSTSNDGDWKPPHVCLADSPSSALGLTHATGLLDLWMVQCDTDDVRRVDDEWRSDGPLDAWWVGQRDHGVPSDVEEAISEI